MFAGAFAYQQVPRLLEAGVIPQTRDQATHYDDLATTAKDDGRFVFSSDWVNGRLTNRIAELGHLRDVPGARGLEVGSFEGRSAIWFIESVLTAPDARLTCIDLFPEQVDQHFDHNIEAAGIAGKIDKITGSSQTVLRGLPLESFDFAYIDGCHRATCTIADIVLTWDLLKTGGIMILDDYGLSGAEGTGIPRPAIDAFVSIYADRIEVLSEDFQFSLKKTAPGH